MSAPLLEAAGLTKRFAVPGGETVTAVDGISLNLEAGGSLAIVGESGSGKSTTVRMIAGLETPSSGIVFLDGAPVASPDPRHRHVDRTRVQMVFQDPYGSFDPRQRIGAALEEGMRRRRIPRAACAARVAELLAQVGLDERHARLFPRELSGGQRQRAAIARALSLDPDIVVLDESLSALDVSVQAQVLNLLIDLRRRTGVAYLFVSHDLAVVRQLCDDCIVMHRGRVVESGTVAEILDTPREPYTRRLIDSIPRPGWSPSRRAGDPDPG